MAFRIGRLLPWLMVLGVTCGGLVLAWRMWVERSRLVLPTEPVLKSIFQKRSSPNCLRPNR